MFYSISYMTHPTRVFRVLWNLIRGKEESRLDVALKGIVDRIRRKKVTLEEVSTGVPSSRV